MPSNVASVRPCQATGEEVCNDKDDDCDLRVDEKVVSPRNDCKQFGVCAGTVSFCGNGSFKCRYPITYEAIESLCDGLDNDCDDKIDEAFPKLGARCDIGTGACAVSGTLRCDAAKTGLVCVAKDKLVRPREVCNGKDDDCDGLIDEPKSTPGANPSYVRDEVAKVRDNLWIYAYEASRADASDSRQGVVTQRACSRSGVLPWSHVTYDEALAAC
jgi:Putative metal-binding motif